MAGGLRPALRWHVPAWKPFQAWRSTPARPGPVMVWRPDQIGTFLDAAEDERLYALFCVIAYCALRRGEAVGQKLAEIDYDAGAAHGRPDHRPGRRQGGRQG